MTRINTMVCKNSRLLGSNTNVYIGQVAIVAKSITKVILSVYGMRIKRLDIYLR